MKEKKIKYAELLLKCLKVDEKDYLFVSIPSFLDEFIDILKEVSKKYNLKEIYFDIVDPFKKHDLMVELDQENINKHPMFDHDIYNKYAKLDAAYLFVSSMVPDLMNDVNPKKIKDTSEYTRSTEKYFRALYETNKLNWCIAGVPNEYWAQKGLNISLDELWELIFKVCLVEDDNDPYNDLCEKLDRLEKTASKLNAYNFKYLEYKNDLGTDLKVYLPEGHIWASGKDEHNVIVNMPTEEVFTSPLYNKTEGIVYSAKPLFYNNIMIEDFSMSFRDGKVIEYHAKSGEEILKGILETDEYSSYLGECALVSYNSPISNTKVVFKDTLYDENASCHLALGAGFNECLKNSNDLREDDLRNLGVNDSKIHIDFMIGDETLNVVGVTQDNKRITIMEDGNIII